MKLGYKILRTNLLHILAALSYFDRIKEVDDSAKKIMEGFRDFQDYKEFKKLNDELLPLVRTTKVSAFLYKVRLGGLYKWYKGKAIARENKRYEVFLGEKAVEIEVKLDRHVLGELISSYPKIRSTLYMLQESAKENFWRDLNKANSGSILDKTYAKKMG